MTTYQILCWQFHWELFPGSVTSTYLLEALDASYII